MHILEEHPEVIKHLNELKNIFKNPDMVLIQNDKKDTIWIVKKLKSNLKITIKLNTVRYEKSIYKNSIIQMQYMHDREIKRNIINGKVKLIWDNTIDIMEKIC